MSKDFLIFDHKKHGKFTIFEKSLRTAYGRLRYHFTMIVSTICLNKLFSHLRITNCHTKENIIILIVLPIDIDGKERTKLYLFNIED